MNSDIIIIGSGAAGMFAGYAASAISNELKITILERKQRPGRKIMITGKGRCNFSNIKDWNEFSKHIRTNPNFIRPAFYNFSPKNLLDFFADRELETVVERGDRAYPASYKAKDIVDVLESSCIDSGVRIVTDCNVESIVKKNSLFEIKDSESNKYTCRKLIVATGGLSYPGTGSTGDGYIWAEQFGHKIKPCFPSLTALVPDFYKDGKAEKNGHLDRSTPLSELGKSLCGIHLKNVGLSLFVNSDLVQHEFGELDFTDGGIEGPIGFEISRNAVKAIFNGNKVRLEINLKDGVSEKELRSRLEGLWKSVSEDPRSRNMRFRDICKVFLGKLMPWELIDGFLSCNPSIISEKKRNLDLNILLNSLTRWSFNIAGYVGYERCVITAGGINTDEVVPKTLESKLCKDLFFCGEVLDIDADTGGYNLQLAFSTGYLAGESAAKSLLSNMGEQNKPVE